MLVYLFDILSEYISFFNVFQYLTVRAGCATLTSLFLVFLFGPWLISTLRIRQGKGQPIRDCGPERHLIEKNGTPTMGGLMILSSLIITAFLWADLTNQYIWIVLLVVVGYGAIGIYDDYLKVTRSSIQGFPGRIKFILEMFIAALACALFITLGEYPLQPSLALPFFSEPVWDMGWFFIIFGALIIVGSGNSVNLTDGLDGLAIVPVMIAIACFGLIVYVTGHAEFAKYLKLPFVKGVGELVIICGSIIGAGLGFLWFNAPPAMIFMGDTGSLSLGGALGAIAVAAKHEIVLAIIGGLFVLETVSVIVQVLSFKLTGKRVFKMAPLHHHFEEKGWAEPTIVIRFWIIAVVLALIGLSTLKLR